MLSLFFLNLPHGVLTFDAFFFFLCCLSSTLSSSELRSFQSSLQISLIGFSYSLFFFAERANFLVLLRSSFHSLNFLSFFFYKGLHAMGLSLAYLILPLILLLTLFPFPRLLLHFLLLSFFYSLFLILLTFLSHPFLTFLPLLSPRILSTPFLLPLSFLLFYCFLKHHSNIFINHGISLPLKLKVFHPSVLKTSLELRNASLCDVDPSSAC